MTLENKLGITDSQELARAEERISKQKALALFESGALDQMAPGTFAALAQIHRALFVDIYDFAGDLRTVNIAKGHFRFASALYLEAAVAEIERMPQNNFDEIVAKYVEMNVAHPFREGNGRSMRIWLDQMLKAALGKVVDWSLVDKEIKTLLGAALTDRVADRALFMKGIDRSYEYEGYTAYRTETL